VAIVEVMHGSVDSKKGITALVEDPVEDDTPFLPLRGNRPVLLLRLEQTERVLLRRPWLLARRRLHGRLWRRIELALAAATAQRKRQHRDCDQRKLPGPRSQIHAKRPQITAAPYKARSAMASP
jgi:hypothetical protein